MFADTLSQGSSHASSSIMSRVAHTRTMDTTVLPFLFELLYDYPTTLSVLSVVVECAQLWSLVMNPHMPGHVMTSTVVYATLLPFWDGTMHFGKFVTYTVYLVFYCVYAALLVTVFAICAAAVYLRGGGVLTHFVHLVGRHLVHAMLSVLLMPTVLTLLSGVLCQQHAIVLSSVRALRESTYTSAGHSSMDAYTPHILFFSNVACDATLPRALCIVSVVLLVVWVVLCYVLTTTLLPIDRDCVSVRRHMNVRLDNFMFIYKIGLAIAFALTQAYDQRAAYTVLVAVLSCAGVAVYCTFLPYYVSWMNTLYAMVLAVIAWQAVAEYVVLRDGRVQWLTQKYFYVLLVLGAVVAAAVAYVLAHVRYNRTTERLFARCVRAAAVPVADNPFALAALQGSHALLPYPRGLPHTDALLSPYYSVSVSILDELLREDASAAAATAGTSGGGNACVHGSKQGSAQQPSPAAQQQQRYNAHSGSHALRHFVSDDDNDDDERNHHHNHHQQRPMPYVKDDESVSASEYDDAVSLLDGNGGGGAGCGMDGMMHDGGYGMMMGGGGNVPSSRAIALSSSSSAAAAGGVGVGVGGEVAQRLLPFEATRRQVVSPTIAAVHFATDACVSIRYLTRWTALTQQLPTPYMVYFASRILNRFMLRYRRSGLLALVYISFLCDYAPSYARLTLCLDVIRTLTSELSLSITEAFLFYYYDVHIKDTVHLRKTAYQLLHHRTRRMHEDVLLRAALVWRTLLDKKDVVALYYFGTSLARRRERCFALYRDALDAVPDDELVLRNLGSFVADVYNFADSERMCSRAAGVVTRMQAARLQLAFRNDALEALDETTTNATTFAAHNGGGSGGGGDKGSGGRDDDAQRRRSSGGACSMSNGSMGRNSYYGGGGGGGGDALNDNASMQSSHANGSWSLSMSAMSTASANGAHSSQARLRQAKAVSRRMAGFIGDSLRRNVAAVCRNLHWGGLRATHLIAVVAIIAVVAANLGLALYLLRQLQFSQLIFYDYTMVRLTTGMVMSQLQRTLSLLPTDDASNSVGLDAASTAMLQGNLTQLRAYVKLLESAHADVVYGRDAAAYAPLRSVFTEMCNHVRLFSSKAMTLGNDGLATLPVSYMTHVDLIIATVWRVVELLSTQPNYDTATASADVMLLRKHSVGELEVTFDNTLRRATELLSHAAFGFSLILCIFGVFVVCVLCVATYALHWHYHHAADLLSKELALYSIIPGDAVRRLAADAQRRLDTFMYINESNSGGGAAAAAAAAATATTTTAATSMSLTTTAAANASPSTATLTSAPVTTTTTTGSAAAAMSAATTATMNSNNSPHPHNVAAVGGGVAEGVDGHGGAGATANNNNGSGGNGGGYGDGGAAATATMSGDGGVSSSAGVEGGSAAADAATMPRRRSSSEAVLPSSRLLTHLLEHGALQTTASTASPMAGTAAGGAAAAAMLARGGDCSHNTAMFATHGGATSGADATTATLVAAAQTSTATMYDRNPLAPHDAATTTAHTTSTTAAAATMTTTTQQQSHQQHHTHEDTTAAAAAAAHTHTTANSQAVTTTPTALSTSRLRLLNVFECRKAVRRQYNSNMYDGNSYHSSDDDDKDSNGDNYITSSGSNDERGSGDDGGNGGGGGGAHVGRVSATAHGADADGSGGAAAGAVNKGNDDNAAAAAAAGGGDNNDSNNTTATTMMTSGEVSPTSTFASTVLRGDGRVRRALSLMALLVVLLCCAFALSVTLLLKLQQGEARHLEAERSITCVADALDTSFELIRNTTRYIHTASHDDYVYAQQALLAAADMMGACAFTSDPLRLLRARSIMYDNAAIALRLVAQQFIEKEGGVADGSGDTTTTTSASTTTTATATTKKKDRRNNAGDSHDILDVDSDDDALSRRMSYLALTHLTWTPLPRTALNTELIGAYTTPEGLQAWVPYHNSTYDLRLPAAQRASLASTTFAGPVGRAMWSLLYEEATTLLAMLHADVVDAARAHVNALPGVMNALFVFFVLIVSVSLLCAVFGAYRNTPKSSSSSSSGSNDKRRNRGSTREHASVLSLLLLPSRVLPLLLMGVGIAGLVCVLQLRSSADRYMVVCEQAMLQRRLLRFASWQLAQQIALLTAYPYVGDDKMLRTVRRQLTMSSVQASERGYLPQITELARSTPALSSYAAQLHNQTTFLRYAWLSAVATVRSATAPPSLYRHAQDLGWATWDMSLDEVYVSYQNLYPLDTYFSTTAADVDGQPAEAVRRLAQKAVVSHVVTQSAADAVAAQRAARLEFVSGSEAALATLLSRVQAYTWACFVLVVAGVVLLGGMVAHVLHRSLGAFCTTAKARMLFRVAFGTHSHLVLLFSACLVILVVIGNVYTIYSAATLRGQTVLVIDALRGQWMMGTLMSVASVLQPGSSGGMYAQFMNKRTQLATLLAGVDELYQSTYEREWESHWLHQAEPPWQTNAGADNGGGSGSGSGDGAAMDDYDKTTNDKDDGDDDDVYLSMSLDKCTDPSAPGGTANKPAVQLYILVELLRQLGEMPDATALLRPSAVAEVRDELLLRLGSFYFTLLTFMQRAPQFVFGAFAPVYYCICITLGLVLAGCALFYVFYLRHMEHAVQELSVGVKLQLLGLPEDVLNAVPEVKAFYSDERRSSNDQMKRKLQQSERLLQNILPPSISRRLKNGERVIADSHASVTAVFASLVGFDEYSSRLDTKQIVLFLNGIVVAFDTIVDLLDLEKVKTIGDTYFFCGGLIKATERDHAVRCMECSLFFFEALQVHNSRHGTPNIKLRVGMNTDAAVAGVIGNRKVAYDLWGDCVNTASRMYSTGLPGRIQVSHSTYELVNTYYRFEDRHVQAKGKGTLLTHIYVDRLRNTIYSDIKWRQSS